MRCLPLLVIAATVCWGLENNCTRSISSKDTYQIVVLKGIFSGLGALVIAFIRQESLPGLKYAAIALILGFASYGLSIFLYQIRVRIPLSSLGSGMNHTPLP